MRKRAWIAGLAMLVLGALAVACGSTSTADPTPVKTFKITPATGSRSATAPPAGTATAAATAGAPEGEGGALTIDGVNSTFDKEELEAAAGSITIEFDNKDGGVPHNIHFFKGKDAKGESVGVTDLDVGPTVQTLDLTVEAGEYFYQCDAHPTTMKGTLTVT